MYFYLTVTNYVITMRHPYLVHSQARPAVEENP